MEKTKTQVPMEHVENREAITLKNNGEKIFAVLHRPLQKGPLPAIVICPGFGGNKCGKNRIFVSLAKDLAKQGIAVLRFDYRGAGDSEGEFHSMTLEGHVSDTLCCLNSLASDIQIDLSRIGILGRSLGGAIAILASGLGFPIKSLALWAPVFKSDPWKNLWESLEIEKKHDRDKQEILRNLPFHIPNLEFLAQFFKLNMSHELENLKNIPLLHIHGEKDQVVKIEHAKEFEKARKGVEKSRFILLPHSDHDFSYPIEQEIASKETVQWFLQTL